VDDLMKQQEKIEYITSTDSAYRVDDSSVIGWGNSRVRLFIVTFLVSLMIGIIINYSRPAVYISNATLLTSAATAVDQRSLDVDFQHVTIQKQKLLGVELLTETLRRMHSADDNTKNISSLTLADVRNMLTVEPIEETNLLNMSAQGPVAEILPVLINSWIDVYLDARALSIKNATSDTVEQVKNELAELELKIEQNQVELGLFRKEHDISSISREENELPATLISLTTAFNKANEEVINTKAKLDAINQAIASGQAVVPKQDQTSLTELESEYRKLKARLAEFDKNFTRDYLQFKGSMKYIPEQIKKLEQQIKQKRELGKGIVWTEASQNYMAASQVLNKIRKQLDEHKGKAVKFTAIFSKHQTLMDDLESMQLLMRETQDRLLKIESKQFEKYPQVDVVERASVNRQAISPDYNIGLFVVLIISSSLAFFTVWFKSYLMQGYPGPEQGDFKFPIASWVGHEQSNEKLVSQQDSRQIEQNQNNELPQLLADQDIENVDIQLLLSHGDKNTQQLILLILSGLELEEISNFKVEQINNDSAAIEVTGKSARVVIIGKALQHILNQSMQQGMLWGEQDKLSITEMNAILYCAAVDLGLNQLEKTLAGSLRQNYIIYLVEQGIRLTALAEIVGYLSPIELAAYGAFSPAGEGCNAEQIQLIHPLCK